MSRDTKDLLEQALKLPPEGRAALAASLLESLDEEIDDDAEAVWRTELERRIAELDAGTVRAVPWSEVRKKIQGV